MHGTRRRHVCLTGLSRIRPVTACADRRHRLSLVGCSLVLRRSLPSDPRWIPAPQVRSLLSHSSQAQVAEALGVRRRRSADALLVSDLAGWDWVVLIGPEDQLLASSLHIDARLAGRISCIVRTEQVVRQLVTQLQCLAFRAPIGFGPNAPWLPAGCAAFRAVCWNGSSR